MQKQSKRRWKWGILIFLLVWVIFAQSCMKFRLADSKAKKAFDEKGVAVNFYNETIDHINLHYVKTGADSLPTLFFVHGSPGSWDAFKIYMLDSALLRYFRIISIGIPKIAVTKAGPVY